MTTFSFTTTKGEVITRRSDADYRYGSERVGGQTRFHKTEAAAKREAGAGGTVHTVQRAEQEGQYKAIACGRCGHIYTTLKCDACGF